MSGDRRRTTRRARTALVGGGVVALVAMCVVASHPVVHIRWHIWRLGSDSAETAMASATACRAYGRRAVPFLIDALKDERPAWAYRLITPSPDLSSSYYEAEYFVYFAVGPELYANGEFLGSTDPRRPPEGSKAAGGQVRLLAAWVLLSIERGTPLEETQFDIVADNWEEFVRERTEAAR